MSIASLVCNSCYFYLSLFIITRTFVSCDILFNLLIRCKSHDCRAWTVFRPAVLRLSFFRVQIFVQHFFLSHFFVLQLFVRAFLLFFFFFCSMRGSAWWLTRLWGDLTRNSGLARGSGWRWARSSSWSAQLGRITRLGIRSYVWLSFGAQVGFARFGIDLETCMTKIGRLGNRHKSSNGRLCERKFI